MSWKYTSDHWTEHTFVDADGTHVSINPAWDESGAAKRDAVGHMIAAAPEMLEALEHIASTVELTYEDWCRITSIIDAAKGVRS